jgi:hypothetical protein
VRVEDYRVRDANPVRDPASSPVHLAFLILPSSICYAVAAQDTPWAPERRPLSPAALLDASIDQALLLEARSTSPRQHQGPCLVHLLQRDGRAISIVRGTHPLASTPSFSRTSIPHPSTTPPFLSSHSSSPLPHLSPSTGTLSACHSSFYLVRFSSRLLYLPFSVHFHTHLKEVSSLTLAP